MSMDGIYPGHQCVLTNFTYHPGFFPSLLDSELVKVF